jgi:hypothetical protein
MKTPKKRRNRRDARLIASFTPAPGPDRHLWLTHFAKRLPDYAARLGLTAAKAESRAGAIRIQFMKTPNATSTP